jgi:hypothetical protein
VQERKNERKRIRKKRKKKCMKNPVTDYLKPRKEINYVSLSGVVGQAPHPHRGHWGRRGNGGARGAIVSWTNRRTREWPVADSRRCVVSRRWRTDRRTRHGRGSSSQSRRERGCGRRGSHQLPVSSRGSHVRKRHQRTTFEEDQTKQIAFSNNW